MGSPQHHRPEDFFNTPPAAPEYAYIRRWPPLPALIVVVPVLLIVGFVLFWPRQLRTP